MKVNIKNPNFIQAGLKKYISLRMRWKRFLVSPTKNIYQKIFVFFYGLIVLFSEILLVVWIVITIIFFLTNSLPGSDALTSSATNQTQKEILEHKYGLDKPIFERYLSYIWHFIQGDFGVSNVMFPGQTINSFIWKRFFVSFTVGGFALLFAYIIIFPIGMIVGQYQGKWPDTTVSILVAALVAIPSLIMGLLLLLFGQKVGIPYIYDMKNFASYVLPITTLVIVSVSGGIKVIRVSIVDEMKSDHAKFAYLKGATKRRFVWIHAIKPASFLIMSTLPTAVLGTFLGSIFIEKIFQLPGSGQLLLNAIQSKDYNVILFMIGLFTAVSVTSFKMRDIMYRLLDPRVRGGGL